MEKFLTSMAALMLLAGLLAEAGAQNRFEPQREREEKERREREERDPRAIHRDDVVGRIEKVRVERDGEVRLVVRRTDYFGRPLEGREAAREVEIKAHQAQCWIFHDRGMREVNVKAVEGKVMNVQWRTVRGRELLELHEMRRPVR